MFVDQLRDDVVSVTRHNPNNHKSVVLVARTAFQFPQNPSETGHIRPIVVQGKNETRKSNFQSFKYT